MTDTAVRPKVGLLALALERYEELAPGLREGREQWVRERVLPAAKRQLELAADAFGNGKISKLKVLQRRREVDAIELEILQGRLMHVVAAIQLEKIAAATAEPGAAR